MSSSVLLRKASVLAAKIETTPGTAISISAADGVFNIYDLDMQPTIPMIDRMGQGSFGRLPSVQGGRSGTFTFKTDLIGGASIPAWMGTFMPACGWVDTTGTLSPKTEPPGSNVKTLTLKGYRNGMYKQIRGAMGSWSIELTPGQPAMVAFTFIGIWDDPADVSIITPTYVTTIPPRFASATLTFGSFSPKISRMTIESGNVPYLRPDATDPSGYAYCCIGDRLPKISIDPEADLIANRDTYGIWKALTTEALSCIIGASGNQVTFAAPKLQITNAQEGDRSGVEMNSIDLQCLRSAGTGNDELTLAYA